LLAIVGACYLSACAPSPQTPKQTPAAPGDAAKADPAKAPSPAPSESKSPKAAAPETPLSGPALYAQHCAGCHGANGDGKGVAATFLFPKPRDFRAGRFRLVSTVNAVPLAADLDAVIRRGMPGSAMPPWPKLTESERALLVAEVQRLRREGAREEFIAQLKQDTGEENPEIDQQEIDDFIKGRTVPGEISATPDIGEPNTPAAARGKELYVKLGCASCHGNEGKGDGQQTMVDIEGLPTRPRDLTLGIYKGGHDAASVYRRIALGMPGTPMPSSTNLKPEQVVDLVHFIRSLSDESTRQAAVLNRERLVAKYVAALPDSIDAAQWKDVPATPLRMMPLWWRNDANPGLTVQAAHDGRAIVFRLQWKDTQADQQAARSEAFRDAAALQLHRGSVEPFLGMGDAKSPVDTWMWDAARQGGLSDVEAVHPRAVVDHYPFSEGAAATAEFERAGAKTESQPDVAFPARAAGNPIATRTTSGSSLTVGGPGSVTFRLPTSQLVDALGQWSSGRWTVVMKRALTVKNLDDGIALEPGGTASVAFAIWEGGLRDRNGQKLVTIWQDLTLEPAQ
jgi:DMSO reductase family type II enzyme heme b subunit